jgi:hypothetical protein
MSDHDGDLGNDRWNDIEGYCPRCNAAINYSNPLEGDGCRDCRDQRQSEENAKARDGLARFILFDIFFGGH